MRAHVCDGSGDVGDGGEVTRAFETSVAREQPSSRDTTKSISDIVNKRGLPSWRAGDAIVAKQQAAAKCTYTYIYI